MRQILVFILICGYNLMLNKEESIVFRLLLPFAIVLGVIREWFTISLFNSTIMVRDELYNLTNWVRAFAFWSVIGGMYLWDRLVPER